MCTYRGVIPPPQNEPLKSPPRLGLRQISESPKRHWISVPWSFYFVAFDLKAKTNFEGETLYKAPISATPSDSRVEKISDSRIFLWVSSQHTKWPSSDFSLIWAECDSSRDLCQALIVRELFKPAEFGSRFSTGAGLQSSSEERMRLDVPFFDGCWLAVLSELVDCWLIKCSVSIKWSSGVSALALVISSCCRYLLAGVLFSFVVEGCLNLLSALLRCRRWFSASWCTGEGWSCGLFAAGLSGGGGLVSVPWGCGPSCWGRLLQVQCLKVGNC